MAYIDVITLQQAKNYLRVDDTLTLDDNDITRMINAALRYIEKRTQLMVYRREKDYQVTRGFINVYDFPINGVVSPTEGDYDAVQKTLRTEYCFTESNLTLTLDVGFENPEDVPEDVLSVAYEIIDLMYSNKEAGKSFMEMLSPLSMELLNESSRFLI